MNTTVGAGRNSVRDFAIDFTDKDTYIGGRSFPKGYFTVAVLNYGKETNTKLLYAGAECNQARRIAEKCKTKACSSVQYFNDRYAADISQAGIYGATEKLLGRPPIQKED